MSDFYNNNISLPFASYLQLSEDKAWWLVVTHMRIAHALVGLNHCLCKSLHIIVYDR